jgi:hypothetical protein
MRLLYQNQRTPKKPIPFEAMRDRVQLVAARQLFGEGDSLGFGYVSSLKF